MKWEWENDIQEPQNRMYMLYVLIYGLWDDLWSCFHFDSLVDHFCGLKSSQSGYECPWCHGNWDPSVPAGILSGDGGHQCD